eukprot:4247559-Amphidinium_carterae.1
MLIACSLLAYMVPLMANMVPLVVCIFVVDHMRSTGSRLWPTGSRFQDPKNLRLKDPKPQTP